jgi:hypothetical protein
MGFLDLFRPKWKHSDLNVRLDAVHNLDNDDTWTLEKVVLGDGDARVRKLALGKLRDAAVLRRVADTASDQELRDEALQKADALLATQACASLDDEGLLTARDALERISTPAALIQVARKAQQKSVRDSALARIDDDKTLAEVAREGNDLQVRLAALARIGDLPTLVHVARESDDKQVGLTALQRIQGDGAVEAVAQQAKLKAVRAAAEARLPRRSAQEKAADKAKAQASKAKKAGTQAMSAKEAKRARQRLLQVCLAVEPWCKTSTDWPAAERAVAEAREKWAEIGSVQGDQQLQDRFAGALHAYDERREHHLREEALRQGELRAAAGKKKAEAAASAAREAATVASAEQQAARALADGERAEAAARAAVAAAAGPTVVEQLISLAVRAERLLERDKLAAERVEELAARWNVLDPRSEAPPPTRPSRPLPRAQTPLPAASTVDDGWDTPEPAASVPAEVAVVAEAAAAAAEAAPVSEPRLALRRRFDTAMARARARAAEGQAALEKERAEAARALEQEALRLEKLLTTSNPARLDVAIKSARTTLRNLRGGDPALRTRIEQGIEALVPRLNELREAESWRRWANLPAFEALIKEAETLAQVVDEVEDKRHAPAVLKELQQRWKAAGSLPQEKSQELWARFKAACDLVHDKSKAFFAKLDEARPENLTRKEALCAEVEALKESTTWKETSDKIKDLQAQWKAIGPVPDEHKDAVWTRFRAACDAFYERRAENDKSRDEEREQNLARKQALVSEVEAIARSTDWKSSADRIKALQEEWKEIGFVPRAVGDELWKRFRAACDAFFDARKAAFAQLDGERGANLEKKLALIAEVEALAELEDNSAAMEKVKGLQAQWKTIGHVPREQSDEVWNRFRAACDRVFEGPTIAELSDEEKLKLGFCGFVNRLDLSGVADKLANKGDGES